MTTTRTALISLCRGRPATVRDNLRPLACWQVGATFEENKTIFEEADDGNGAGEDGVATAGVDTLSLRRDTRVSISTSSISNSIVFSKPCLCRLLRIGAFQPPNRRSTHRKACSLRRRRWLLLHHSSILDSRTRDGRSRSHNLRCNLRLRMLHLPTRRLLLLLRHTVNNRQHGPSSRQRLLLEPSSIPPSSAACMASRDRASLAGDSSGAHEGTDGR